MCFDDQVLSAFYDEELEEIWKGKVADHLESCPVCSAKVASFQRTGVLLSSIDVPEKPFQQNAVWERIRHSVSTEQELGFWSRRVSLVRTIGAIAAVSILVFGISLFVNRKSKVSPLTPGISLSSGEVIQTGEIGSFIKLVKDSDDSSVLFIQLPDKTDFKFLGEPQFLREADYVRGR